MYKILLKKKNQQEKGNGKERDRDKTGLIDKWEQRTVEWEGVNKVRVNGRWCVEADYFDACRWVPCWIVMCVHFDVELPDLKSRVLNLLHPAAPQWHKKALWSDASHNVMCRFIAACRWLLLFYFFLHPLLNLVLLKEAFSDLETTERQKWEQFHIWMVLCALCTCTAFH